ncbi:hypothetical protein GCM10023238_01400 [Streptomyces heliomycini]
MESDSAVPTARANRVITRDSADAPILRLAPQAWARFAGELGRLPAQGEPPRERVAPEEPAAQPGAGRTSRASPAMPEKAMSAGRVRAVIETVYLVLSWEGPEGLSGTRAFPRRLRCGREKRRRRERS